MQFLRRILAYLLLIIFLVSTSRSGTMAAPRNEPDWTPYRNIESTIDGPRQQASLLPQPMPQSIPQSITDSNLDKLRIASVPSLYYPADPGYSTHECPPFVSASCPSSSCPPAMGAPMIMGGSMMTGVSSKPQAWQWHILPNDVIYHSYGAGAHEPRVSGVIFHDLNGKTTYLDASLGGRLGLIRYGTSDRPDGLRPQGWEFDIEGAAFPRLNLDENWDLEAVDFRIGFPITYGQEKWQGKFSYYHLSSHMGDEYAMRQNSLTQRINFSRDVLVLGGSYFPLAAWRWYAEAGWSFYYDGGSKPWEFQFGIEYAQSGPTGFTGTPFLALNGHLREEVDFGGNMVFQAGWLWQGQNDNRLRLGFHYFNGKSNQFEFFDEFEEQIGGGLWYEY